MNEIISFYKNVFNQEISRSKLHLDSKKVLKKLLFNDVEELTNGAFPIRPISDKLGEDFLKDLKLKGSQVELKYYSLARLSKFTSFNIHEVERIFPLVSYDAEIIKKTGNYYVKLNLDSKRFIKTNFSQGQLKLIDFDILESNTLLDFETVSTLSSSLELDDSNAEDLRLFPELLGGRKIKNELKKLKPGEEKFVSLGALCIIEKQNFSFDTLNELNQLEKSENFSDALRASLGQVISKSPEQQSIICEELNFSQQLAIENSNNSTLSLISGPPGTGKSFTIANIAIEKISKGQSVLIASKNTEALEVIERKINKITETDHFCVNPSREKNLNSLKHHLKHILSRAYLKEDISVTEIKNEQKLVKDKLQALSLNEEVLEHTFNNEKLLLQNVNTNKFTKKSSTDFRERIIKSRALKSIPLWNQLLNYYDQLEEFKTNAVHVILKTKQYYLNHHLERNKIELKNYFSFLKARDISRKTELLTSFRYETILQTHPIWLVKMSDIARVLPLKMEMFDFLIIDEASQCDIPSVLPLLQRAKNVIVVGDTNQLSHISFLAKDIEEKFRQKVDSKFHYLCQHRDYSFLSLIEDNIDPSCISNLTEHFRSQHEIIEFSNQIIYENQLEILTKRPIKNNNAVELIQCKGVNQNSVNQKEIDQIIEKIRLLVETEKPFNQFEKTSIGILSPFRKQVDAIQKQVKQNFKTSEIEDHQIMIGTAFTFQGNERDLMILSFVVDDQSVAGSYNYINRKDVFNVSVTRARSKQIVLYSFDYAKLKHQSTLGQFFQFYQKYASEYYPKFDKDEFCLEIKNYIQQLGFDAWEQFSISGVNIDILAQKDNQYIAIDLIGFPGSIGDFYPLERYKMLERGGIRLFPLPYAYWLYDKSFCLKAIENLCLSNTN
ncbi:MAG: AAA domain-containing protein [Putridiphycobacter sp.]